MNLNIVTAGNWVLRLISERIVAHNTDPNVRISISSDVRPTTNLFVDAGVYDGSEPLGLKNIAFFTHLHKNSLDEHFKYYSVDKLRSLDGLIFMCERYRDIVVSNKIYQGPTSVCRPGVYSNRFKPNIKIGIFQRGNAEGKGPGVILELFHQFDLNGFEFIFVGSEWNQILQVAGANVKCQSYPQENYSQYPDLYDKIDYLIIPSLWEGGPLSILEAMSCGIPVISSDVGWARELEVDHLYPPGDVGALFNILDNIRDEKLSRRSKVVNMTWDKFSSGVVEFCSNV